MRIILASASPRRIDLLNQFGIAFETIPSHIEEQTAVGDAPEKTVMALSFLKADALSKVYPDALVIASDTIVYDYEALGKPSDRDAAIEMLRRLNGKAHSVYTGVALLHRTSGKKVVFYEKTTVVFNTLSEAEIIRYVDKAKPFDKAGAYGIQGIGALLVDAIKGDYYTVMGLPLSHLNRQLKDHFGIELL